MVDLDDDTEQALRAIESICGRDASITVMAASSRSDANLMRRSMQAGAREFLLDPLIARCRVRSVYARFARQRNREKALGKTLVFVPSKGGIGITTIAANFALALTRESGAKVVIVDMDFELGEVALGLGMIGELLGGGRIAESGRLDKRISIHTCCGRHSSGLAVLASPEEYSASPAPDRGRGQVVPDSARGIRLRGRGCRELPQPHAGNAVHVAGTIYLVTEMTFPGVAQRAPV